MSEFDAAGLLTVAQGRYGADKLRARMRGSEGKIAALIVVAGGSGYSTATLSFGGPPGTGAAGTVTLGGVGGDEVVAADLTDRGKGYTVPPDVTVTGDGSSAAEVVAVLLADSELAKIAKSVLARAQTALQKSGRWPLPGKYPAGSTDELGQDITGTPFAERWPDNLLQKALELFNWRTVAGLQAATSQEQRVGQAAEKYFDGVASGDEPIGIGGDDDVGPPEAFSARNRDGSSNLASVPDYPSILDRHQGGGWDW